MIQALGYLKEICGINHRDVKPQNILMFAKSDGTVTWKLSDLGAVKLMDVYFLFYVL